MDFEQTYLSKNFCQHNKDRLKILIGLFVINTTYIAETMDNLVDKIFFIPDTKTNLKSWCITKDSCYVMNARHMEYNATFRTYTFAVEFALGFETASDPTSYIFAYSTLMSHFRLVQMERAVCKGKCQQILKSHENYFCSRECEIE